MELHTCTWITLAKTCGWISLLGAMFILLLLVSEEQIASHLIYTVIKPHIDFNKIEDNNFEWNPWGSFSIKKLTLIFFARVRYNSRLTAVSWDIVLWRAGNSFKCSVKKPFFREEVFEESAQSPVLPLCKCCTAHSDTVPFLLSPSSSSSRWHHVQDKRWQSLKMPWTTLVSW